MDKVIPGYENPCPKVRLQLFTRSESQPRDAKNNFQRQEIEIKPGQLLAEMYGGTLKQNPKSTYTGSGFKISKF